MRVHVCWRKRKWSECRGKKKGTIVLRASSQTDQGAEEAPGVKAVQLPLRDCSLCAWEGEMKTDRKGSMAPTGDGVVSAMSIDETV